MSEREGSCYTLTTQGVVAALANVGLANEHSDEMVRLRVKQLVEARGLTWQKFGEETGLSKQTVHALIKGKTTRIDFGTLETLCRYFNVPVNEVIEVRLD